MNRRGFLTLLGAAPVAAVVPAAAGVTVDATPSPLLSHTIGWSEMKEAGPYRIRTIVDVRKGTVTHYGPDGIEPDDPRIFTE